MTDPASVRGAATGDLVEPGSFREAMSAVPGPVTIVTGTDDQGMPWGFTASSLVSVSLSPPLVLVSVGRSSSCRRALLRGRDFVVNVLGDQHRDVAMRFATSKTDRFAGEDYPRWGGSGPPFLPDAVVMLHCEVHQVVPAGDHDLVLGAVTAAVSGPAFGPGTEPLVWVRRGFARACA